MALAAALVGGATASAENYFFSPEGAGEMDGTSWENAAPGEYLGATVEGLQIGDKVYLQGGAYMPDRNTGVWTIPQGVEIRGGYPATMKGTDTAISYPTGAETIWSADLDGDGVGDNGGRAFIWIMNELTSDPNEGKFSGDKTFNDFAKTTLAGITVRDAYFTGTAKYKGAALFAVHATVEFDHMTFINNTNTLGGGVVTLQGCKAYIYDSKFNDNIALTTGAGLLIRQHNGGTTQGDPSLWSYTYMDRCEINNNTCSDPDAQYGGNMALADGGGVLYMNNCISTNSHIKTAGGFLRCGGGTVFYSTNNTFYNCTCWNTKRYNGAILSMGTDSKFYAANTVMCNAEDGKEGEFSSVFIQTVGCTFASAGYNVWGSLFNNAGEATNTGLAATDNVVNTNTMAVVFGADAAAADVDGWNVIAPQESYRNVNKADMIAACAAFDLPSELDLNVDITGKVRPDVTVPGCYDANATSGVFGVEAAAPATTLRRIADGVYAVDCAAEAYDLAGRRVATSNGNTLDLSAAATGVYIVRMGDKSVKIAK